MPWEQKSTGAARKTGSDPRATGGTLGTGTRQCIARAGSEHVLFIFHRFLLPGPRQGFGQG